MDTDLARRVGAASARAVLQLVKRRVRAPLTSSVGRLFDAVASLAGVCDCCSFEGQAAMRLEALATGLGAQDAYCFEVQEGTAIDAAPVVRGVLSDVRRGVDVRLVARRFHSALARAIAETSARLRESHGVDAVVLSGGVFSNAVLTSEVLDRLAALGLRAYSHRRVPPNDGGLSLGQLAIAAARDQEGD